MKKAIRTATINIDTIVPNSFRWVNATIQTVEIDDAGEITSISPNSMQLYRRIDKVATEFVTITDPVTGEEHKLSVAGIGLTIEAIMVQWMLEDNPDAYLDEESGRIILNGSNS